MTELSKTMRQNGPVVLKSLPCGALYSKGSWLTRAIGGGGMPEVLLVAVMSLRNLKGKHLEIYLLGELFYYKNLRDPIWGWGVGGTDTFS